LQSIKLAKGSVRHDNLLFSFQRAGSLILKLPQRPNHVNIFFDSAEKFFCCLQGFEASLEFVIIHEPKTVSTTFFRLGRKTFLPLQAAISSPARFVIIHEPETVSTSFFDPAEKSNLRLARRYDPGKISYYTRAK